jgi:hypothetical protein
MSMELGPVFAGSVCGLLEKGRQAYERLLFQAARVAAAPEIVIELSPNGSWGREWGECGEKVYMMVQGDWRVVGSKYCEICDCHIRLEQHAAGKEEVG